MQKTLIVSIVAVVVALVSFFAVHQSHGLFEASDVIAKGRDMGGFTQEMLEEYYVGEMKSTMASVAIWGALLAATAGVVLPNSNGRWFGLVSGLILGALGGLLAGYLSRWHYNHFDFKSGPMGYWALRTAVVVGPIGLAMACATSIGQRSLQAFTDTLVSCLIGVVLTAGLVAGLLGAVTPNEDFSLLFLLAAENRALLIGTFTVVALVLSQVSLSKSLAKNPQTDVETTTEMAESTAD